MARGKSPTFELQREAILQEAARLFADKGFHNASMAELAAACGVSKPLLYHYYRDKEHILFDIADSYMDRLLAIVAGVEAQDLEPQPQLAELVMRFMAEYAHSQSQHMVLVQDVKFLQAEQSEQVVGKQRKVVAAFAAAIEAVEPGLKKRKLDKPVAMILFGMINWTFTWLRADGRLTYADMAPVVTAILLNGVKGLLAQLPARGRKPPAEADAA
ncbi:TetR/AcrR family transcriptional regulator [Azoarcus olearius]|uniref:TetR family transcriptional regulator n=1 Tax=Azoarcus sp. (strain BH72) TaxID=418699 RepID=A1K271_AZOSB|nr:TetR/AcrR family transcriptional regulator [Azoarcus olearius]ANQ83399.1 TetR family transcriptional regulator [Azoarcus olearius]CAL92926.1 putative TetR family transcriptional regulator [Azoarcus olearius]